MAQLSESAQRTAIRQEIKAQIPQDDITLALQQRLLQRIMRNGHEPNPHTAFSAAMEAAAIGDVRATAISLEAIPESATEYPIEMRARIFTEAVHNLRDGILDQMDAGTATPAMIEAFPVVQGLFNALRDINGTLEMTGPFFGDPHRAEGSRRNRLDAPQVIPSGLPLRRPS
ncbi:MAG TPA: hypothetical protein VF820_00830 [Patescibacteria group bacterium]